MFRFIIIAIVCTGMLIPIAGFSSNIISNGAVLIALTFGLGYVALPILLLSIWPEAKGKRSKSIQDALWDGELLTTEYESCAVAQIEETEDEGLHFLVTTQTGETIFLSGQYLYELVERNMFPSERFRIFKNKTTGESYGIEPAGTRLASWSTFGPFAPENSSANFFPEDGVLYPETIGSLVAKLGLQVAAQNGHAEGSGK